MEVLAIVGPTGAGKSGLALNLAESLGPECEVINADAFSLYRGMDIGTAKVLAGERRGIPHHLIDILDPIAAATIADYQKVGRTALEAVLARGNLPIVVGGSGLYVRALLDEMELPSTDSHIRSRLNTELAELGIETMYQRLVALDPQAAASIGHQNGRRIIRALEVIELTGKPFKATLPAPVYRYQTLTIGLDFDRAALDSRLRQRVDNMRAQGLLDEVRNLASPAQGGTGQGLGPTAIRAVGYYELLPVLRGELDPDTAFEQVFVHTRQLTRKQMGWFGRDARIKWFDGFDPNLTGQVVSYLADLPLIQSAGMAVPGGPHFSLPFASTTRTPLGSTVQRG